MAKPPNQPQHIDLPPAVFDPGEVTATYPIGALTKNLQRGIVDLDDEGTSQVVDGMREADAHEAPTAPRSEQRTQTPLTPSGSSRSGRTVSSSSPTMSPALLMMLSLLGGGGLAVLVVLTGLAIYMTLG